MGSSSVKSNNSTIARGSRAPLIKTGLSSNPVAPIFNIGKRTEPEPPSQSRTLPKLSRKRPFDSQQTHAAKRTKLAHLEEAAPLAEKLRPNHLSQFVGQRHLIGPDSLLTTMLANGPTGSIIFWGPPG